MSNYAFTSGSINVSAPEQSGVYAIFNSERWLYVGESNNIRRRLLEHFNENGTCLKRNAPTGFTCELQPAWSRVNRQNDLIVQLRPTCNRMFG
mgnify:CR=1 FL=1